MSKKEYYIDIFRAKKRSVIYFWTRIKAKNGKILWSSEMLTAKHNAFNPVMKLVKLVGKRKCLVTYYDKIKNESEVL